MRVISSPASRWISPQNMSDRSGIRHLLVVINYIKLMSILWNNWVYKSRMTSLLQKQTETLVAFVFRVSHHRMIRYHQYKNEDANNYKRNAGSKNEQWDQIKQSKKEVKNLMVSRVKNQKEMSFPFWYQSQAHLHLLVVVVLISMLLLFFFSWLSVLCVFFIILILSIPCYWTIYL